MPIYDQGYRRWTGELRRHPLRWWPILRQGVLGTIKKRKVIFLLSLAWLPVFVRGVILFLDMRAGRLLKAGGFIDSGMGFYYQVLEHQQWAVLLFVVLVGSDLISRDRQYNALQIYFSKPLTPNDYILGKLGIVGVFVALVTWVPTMLLWIFALMLNGTFAYLGEVWAVPLAATGYLALLLAVAGLLILALSSVGRRGVYVAGSWLILFGYGPLQLVVLLLKELSGSEYWGLVGMAGNIGQVGAWWFTSKGPHEFHPGLSLLALLLVSGLSYAVLRRRIEPVEVVL